MARVKAYQPTEKPLTSSFGNLVRTLAVIWRPSSVPSTTIAASMHRHSRLPMFCRPATGTTTVMKIRIASGMNRPMRWRRESTESRMKALTGPRSRTGSTRSSPAIMRLRRSAEASRRWVLSPRVAFARFIASRCVLGAGATGPRRRPSASRRDRVGRPLPVDCARRAPTETTSCSSAASVTPSVEADAEVALEPRRRKFTRPG